MLVGLLNRLGVSARANTILACLLVVSALAVFAAGHVFFLYDDFRRELSADELPALSRLTEANRRLQQLQKDLQHQYGPLPGEEREQFEVRLATLERALLDERGEVARLFGDALKPLQRDFTRYNEAFTALLDALTVDGPKRQKMLVRSEVAMDAIDQSVSLLASQIEQRVAQRAELLQERLRWRGIPALLGVLLLVAVSFVQIRRYALGVGRTLSQVRAVAGELAAGRTSVDIAPAEDTAEAREIAASLEKYRHALVELEAMRADLKAQVEERTERLAATNFDLETQLILLRQAQSHLRMYRKVFESAAEAIVVTALDGSILDVNAAYEATTGYSRDDVIGRNPRIAQSGRHDKDFYAAMWHEIRTTGGWSGEIWDRRKNGEIYPKLLSIRTVLDDRGEPVSYVGVFTDISKIKNTEQELEQLAFYDRLTGLPNRRLLLDRMNHALALAGRTGSCGALFFLDLDHFKNINDTKGHQVGDQLLETVAARLKESVRAADTVGRLAGDEFLVIAEELSENPHLAAIQARSIGEKIVTALSVPYRIGEHEFHCSTSVGIALFSAETVNMEDLLVRADTAMYEAKKGGRNTLRFFDPTMQDELQLRVELENRMRVGLRENRFFLVYQPQVDDHTRITGFEALLRWQDPERGEVAPGAFIQVAEESAFIRDLDRWVLDAACRTLVEWQQQPELAGLPLSVNVSALTFAHPDFVDDVLDALDRHGVDPALLKLELTESVVMSDVDQAVERMSRLQTAGVRLAMDDFGTGYSSLAYLRRFSFDQIKIDRSFIVRMLQDPSDAFIVHTVLTMGLMLKVDIVAEGVEDARQYDALTAMGCTYFQGYLFSRPIRKEACQEWVRRCRAGELKSPI